MEKHAASVIGISRLGAYSEMGRAQDEDSSSRLEWEVDAPALAKDNPTPMSGLQKILIGSYAALQKTGILDAFILKKLLILLYFKYKQWYEDPFPGFIRRHPGFFRNGHVLDVGACLGFNSFLFSRAISPGYRVYAFEPDSSNFFWLGHMIRQARAQESIVAMNAAVGSADGTIDLWHNNSHFGDHRVLTAKFREMGIHARDITTVPLVSIDRFIELQSLLPRSVKFIKVDVQGYELEICKGMEKTLLSNHDIAVAVEYAPGCMGELGFEPENMLKWFQDREYHIYAMRRNGRLSAAEEGAIRQMVERQGYVDLLCSRRKVYPDPGEFSR